VDSHLSTDFMQQDCAVSLTEVNNLQSQFEYPLPTSYRQFLQQYGNVVFTYPLPNSVLISINNKRLIGGINHFLSPHEAYALYEKLREDSFYAEEPQISLTMLPIAEMVDLNEGHYILLNLEDGRVFANMFELSQADDLSTYGVIAHSFEEFLSLIQTHNTLETIVGEDALYELINVEKR